MVKMGERMEVGEFMWDEIGMIGLVCVGGKDGGGLRMRGLGDERMREVRDGGGGRGIAS